MSEQKFEGSPALCLFLWEKWTDTVEGYKNFLQNRSTSKQKGKFQITQIL